ncbi:MAG: GYD domain-containing protein [Acetobacteraceae bacterium]|nr:GYD domain-containing protein [Acetobacteraceae bacterium]
MFGGRPAEQFGGRLDNTLFASTAARTDWDGFNVIELPDDAAAEALYMTVEASGNCKKQVMAPLVTAEQFEVAMESARQANGGWTPPTSTK